MGQDPTVFFYVYMHALFSSHIFLLSFLNVECRTLHLVTWAEVPTGKHKSTPWMQPHEKSRSGPSWKKWAISWHCRISRIKAFLFFLFEKWAMPSNSSPGLRRTSDSTIFRFNVLGYYQWHCFGSLCWVPMPLASWSIFASRKDIDWNCCIEF